MMTNTPRQQATRRMTPAEKAAMIAERIAADTEQRREHERSFRAMQAMWNAAYAVGLSPAELNALDFRLARGADPDVLRAELAQR